MFSRDKVLLIIPIICVALYYGIPIFMDVDSNEYPTELIFLIIPITVIAMNRELSVQSKIVLITPFAIFAGFNLVETYMPDYIDEARLSFLVIPIVAILLNGYDGKEPLDYSKKEEENSSNNGTGTVTRLKRSNNDF